MFLPDIFSGMSLVCLGFMVFWIFKFPTYIWADMTFRGDNKPPMKILMFIVLWIWAIASINAITIIGEFLTT